MENLLRDGAATAKQLDDMDAQLKVLNGQLEALLSGATASAPRGPSRRSEPFTDAQAAAALRASGENLSAAARTLGCARSTLRDRLDRLSPIEARS